MREIWFRLERTDAINWIVITVVAALNFVGSFVVTNSHAAGRELLFVGCVVVSLLVVISLLLIARYWILPVVSAKVRPLVLLLTLEVTALARALIFDVLLVGLGLSPDDLLLSRIYASQFNIFVAGLVVSSLVSMARDFSESNARLVVALDELRVAQDDIELRLRDRRHALVSSIKAQLERSLSALTGKNVSSDAQNLKSLIDDVVRPISHKLGREFEATRENSLMPVASTIKWSTVVTHALGTNPIHPLWLTIWTAFISLQVIALAAGSNFLFPYLSAVAGFGLWFFFARVLWSCTSRKLTQVPRAITFSLLIMATPVIVNYLLQLEFRLMFFNARVVIAGAFYFFVMGWSLALVIAVSHLLRTTNKELVAATNQLRRQLIADNIGARHFEQAVSQVLHGPIQDAIAASLKRIQSLPPDALPGNTEGEIIRHHVEGALELLDESPLRLYSVNNGVEELAQLWSGVVEIELTCDKQTFELLDQAQTTSSIVMEVIREAVSNAIRHGDASHIYVSITLCENKTDVSITVKNNGSLIPVDFTAGIGTKLLDDMTLSWSRNNESEGVLLTATVPLHSLSSTH